MAEQKKHKTNKKRKTSHKKKRRLNYGFLFLIVSIIILGIIFTTALLRTDKTEPVSAETPKSELPLSELKTECFSFSGTTKAYASDTIKSIAGIDVSSHNGEINWELVSDSGIEFAIIRAGFRGYGQGDLVVDEYLLQNIQNATAAGIDVGLYFFSQAICPSEAAEEARLLINAVQTCQITYPVYFDWEPIDDETARTSTISATELTDCALAFCKTIESAGYRAGIYFNLSQAYNSYNLVRLKDYEFWLAEYTDCPSFPYQVSTWQYTNMGSCEGIARNVDLDLYFIKKND